MADKLLFSDEVLDELATGSLLSQINQTPVTVLGKTFANDDERRAYFREELRKKLPELKQIEGYPIGEDDDIINLSDPPYYTACPNPWLNNFIAQWEDEKKELVAQGIRKENKYVNEPYAADISDIKNDSVYRAHTYHTKVPHTVVMRYLLHYTQPGDIVFDGFAGTGMTGLACQTCESPTLEVAQKVLADLPEGEEIQWGRRHGICSDLSPYASVISYNYNTPVDVELLKNEATRIEKELKQEFGWMYETKHSDGSVGEIKCVIWSDLVVCPNCGEEYVLWNSVVDKPNKLLKNKSTCPKCGAECDTDNIPHAYSTKFDELLNDTIDAKKTIPVRVIYEVRGKRFEKEADSYDLSVIERIENLTISNWVPITSMMEKGEKWGDTWRAGVHKGITSVHHFYSKRNLCVLAAFYDKVNHSAIPNKLRFLFTGMINRSTIMNRVHFNKYLNGKTDWDAGHLKGTLYIPSFPVESSVIAQISNKLGRYVKAAPCLPSSFDNALSVGTANVSLIKDSSIDYIFVDPPFGANIMYSELNFLAEAWLKVITNNHDEAIINDSQEKDELYYLNIMTACFKEFYRILKEGKWMTIEFSNTSASIWNSIQTAISKSGFIISNVSALNKGQGGMRSITTTTAVKQDLAITCYKPSEKIHSSIHTRPDDCLWDLVDEHLCHIAKYLKKDDKTYYISERDERIIYDRIISYYIQNGLAIPLDAKSFQRGLRDRYIEKDGMFFTAIQAAEYEEKKKNAPEFVPMGIIVSDESNGIQWLKNFLRNSPKTYQEIQPEWMQAINGLRKGDILPELATLLDENFIEMEGGKWRLPNIQDDVDKEMFRTKSLLREFKLYAEQAQKPKARIQEVRVEALRAGFKRCYIDKDFQTIVMVGDKIPQNLLTEDEILLQFYDIAVNHL